MPDPKLLDREDVVELFREMLATKRNARFLRITGESKMGKSRLLREFRSIALSEFGSSTTIIDMRNELQNYADYLFAAGEHLGMENFPHFQEEYNTLLGHNLNVSRSAAIFSHVEISAEEGPTREANRRRTLTAAFIGDLRSFQRDRQVVLLFDQIETAKREEQVWLIESLAVAIYSMENVFLVLAGRQLPAVPSTCEDICEYLDLPAVDLQTHLSYCLEEKINLSEEVVSKFHKYFDGNPGLFLDAVPKIQGDA